MHFIGDRNNLGIFFFVSLTLLVIDATCDPLVEYYLRQLVVIECKRRKKFTFDWWKVVVIERNDLQSYRNASNMLTTTWEISWIASISPQTKEERIEEVTNDNNDDNITIEYRWWWRWYCENYKRNIFFLLHPWLTSIPCQSYCNSRNFPTKLTIRKHSC